jgi:hypothetical protein
MFEDVIDYGKNTDIHGKTWHIKRKTKGNVINEYVCHLVLLAMGYSSPDTIILKDGNTYYCASEFLNYKGPDPEWNDITKKYYIIIHLLPCIFGGHEPCEMVPDWEGKPSIIDCEMNFNYDVVLSDIYDVRLLILDLKADQSLICSFLKDLTEKYHDLVKIVSTQSSYGYQIHIKRILRRLKQAYVVALGYINNNCGGHSPSTGDILPLSRKGSASII